MKCPICQSDFIQINFGNLAVEKCPNGHGLLFGQPSDLKAVLDGINRIENTSEEPIFLDKKIIGNLQIPQGEIICPICNGQMKPVNYLDRSNVFIYDCSDCKAKWVREDDIKKLAIFEKGNSRMMEIGESLEGELKEDAEEETIVEHIGPSMMYPVLTTTPILLGEDDRPTIFPIATIGLIFLTGVIFLCQTFSPDPSLFLKLWSFRYAHFSIFSLILSLFIHENFIHFGTNMFYLWIIGDEIEAKIKPVPYVFYYVILGALASFLGATLFHYDYLVGASGAIAVIMGAYLCLYPTKKFKVLFLNSIFHVPAYIFLGLWILGNILLSIFLKDTATIAYGVHVVGFILGFISMYGIKRLTKETEITPAK